MTRRLDNMHRKADELFARRGPLPGGELPEPIIELCLKCGADPAATSTMTHDQAMALVDKVVRRET